MKESLLILDIICIEDSLAAGIVAHGGRHESHGGGSQEEEGSSALSSIKGIHPYITTKSNFSGCRSFSTVPPMATVATPIQYTQQCLPYL